jgi:hypothetical protein
MISQLQTLQQVVITHLGDVVDWKKHVHTHPDRKSATDASYVEIRTPFNRYTLGMGTAYADPPSGAPVECRSRGWIMFDDPVGHKHIIEPKADAAYTQISKHIHFRELTDALAAARQQLAEPVRRARRWLRANRPALIRPHQSA